MARISIRRCRSASSKRSDNPKLFPARPTLKSAVHGWGGVFGTNLRAALVARLTCIGCGPDAFVPEFVFTLAFFPGQQVASYLAVVVACVSSQGEL